MFLQIGTFMVGFLLSLVFIANCRNFYISKKHYKRRMFLKQNITDNTNKVIGILSQIKKDYPDYVFLTISSKIKYLAKKIQQLDLEAQNIFYDKLWKMSYETQVRLQTDYYNIPYLIAPLNNINNEIEKTLEN